VPDLSVWQWLVLALGSMLVGYSKTAINVVASIAVVLFAAVLPARESTGTLLPLLIVGDITAIAVYRRHANWRVIGRLMPWIVVGLISGSVFIAHVDNRSMRMAIGILILVLLITQLWFGRHRIGLTATGAADFQPDRDGTGVTLRAPGLSFAAGTTTGFVTMIANASGPIMTLYFLASGLTVIEIVGASAWLFFIINLVKLPFSIGLGLLHPASVLLDLTLLPTLGLGAWIGARTIRRIGRVQFERYVLVLVGISAALLLL
jgi:uncharacterized membrane protein YfcA